VVALDKASGKSGSRLDEAKKREAESLERSGKESRVEEFREQEGPEDQDQPSGHRIAGSGSSAESYSYEDKEEQGGKSHPKPKEDEG
jgi:hypothetical protein